MADLVLLNDNVGADISKEENNAKIHYDFNEDGIIDLKDRSILKKNYGKRSE